MLINIQPFQLHRFERPMRNDLGTIYTPCSVSDRFSLLSTVVQVRPNSNILQRRFELSEYDAGLKASYLLSGSIFLYPIVSVHYIHGGFITNGLLSP